MRHSLETLRNAAFTLALASLLVTGAELAGAQTRAPDGEELAESQSAYHGARLLRGDDNVLFEDIKVGPYGDEGSQRYAYFEGDTLYAGVHDERSGNNVDLIAETYWFESSVWRNSDFYVVVIKVKSSPNPADNWFLKTAEPWWEHYMPWIDNEEVAHFLQADMDPSGEMGAVRWDWSVPFDSYKWEPAKIVQIQSGYSAGVDGDAGFSEGGFMSDLTDKSNIQAKGYVKAQHKVSTKYTVTLYKWQVLVSSSGPEQGWQMRVLADGNSEENAYHEYFLVIQADKGAPVRLDSIRFGGNFHKSRTLWFDDYDGLSAELTGLTFSPPGECYSDDLPPADRCVGQGVCDGGVALCDLDLGAWACSFPPSYEEGTELTCDGLDNNCDGQIDEVWPNLGKPCDGIDPDRRADGRYVCAPDGFGIICDEDPCSSVECGEGCGTCKRGSECRDGLCFEVEVDPCQGIGEAGACDGDVLKACVNGHLATKKCDLGCGFFSSRGVHECMEEQAEVTDSNTGGNNNDMASEGPSFYGDLFEPIESTCEPSCGNRFCGSDGCGGTCGFCADSEVCGIDQRCHRLFDPAAQAASGEPTPTEPPAGWGPQTTVIPQAGCHAGAAGAAGNLLLLVGLALAAALRRRSRRA